MTSPRNKKDDTEPTTRFEFLKKEVDIIIAQYLKHELTTQSTMPWGPRHSGAVNELKAKLDTIENNPVKLYQIKKFNDAIRLYFDVNSPNVKGTISRESEVKDFSKGGKHFAKALALAVKSGDEKFKEFERKEQEQEQKPSETKKNR